MSLAIVLGLSAGVFVCLVAPGGDALWPVYGARRLLAGVNPYAAPYPELTSEPAFAWLYYPLPALLLCMPVAWLPDRVVLGVLCGSAVALLACGVRSQQWLVLASYPLWACLWYAQPWPLLIAAAWLLPSLAPLALAKPNAALPALLSRPTWQTVPVAIVLLLCAASVPLGWLAHAGEHLSTVALATPAGCLAALTILRYRNPRARLVLLTAVTPLRIVDPVALLLIPRSWPPALLLCAVSWLAWPVWRAPELLIGAAAIVALIGRDHQVVNRDVANTAHILE